MATAAGGAFVSAAAGGDVFDKTEFREREESTEGENKANYQLVIISVFILLIIIAWNDWIRNWILSQFSDKDRSLALFTYAVVATILFVSLIIILLCYGIP